MVEFFFFFFNCYLAVPQPTLGHSQGDSLTNPMLITVFVQVRPEGHREPLNEVGSLSPAERKIKILVKLEVEAHNFTKISLLHGCFSRLLNCANDTKSSKASHMHFLFNVSGFCDSFSGIHALQKSTFLNTIL